MESLRYEDFKKTGLVYQWTWERGVNFHVWQVPTRSGGYWVGKAYIVRGKRSNAAMDAEIAFVRQMPTKEAAIYELLAATKRYFAEQARAIEPYIFSLDEESVEFFSEYDLTRDA